MPKIEVEHVFDLSKFLEDIDSFIKRRNISRRELARAIDISPSTLDVVWQKGIISLSTAVVLATVCDLDFNKYIIDFLEHDVIPTTPVGRSKAAKERARLADKAKMNAMRRLAKLFVEDFKELHNQERKKVGLPPVK